MEPKVLEALQGSIKKWEGIVAGTTRDEGSSNCPLCQMFNNPFTEETELDCRGCPVMERTGKRYCEGTPYEGFLSGHFSSPYTQESLEVAKEEVAFLQSLLPEPPQPSLHPGEPTR